MNDNMQMMQEKARVGGKELTAMVTVLVATQAFLNYPRYISQSGLEAAWMEPLFSGVLTIVIFYIVDALISRRYPTAGLVEICEIAFGRVIGGVFSMIFVVWFLVITASIMRQFMENVITTVLPRTPLLLVGALFVGSVIYIVHCGLEGIARVGHIALPLLVLGIAGVCLLTMNWWQPTGLFPFWGPGLPGLLRGTLESSSIFLNLVVLMVARPHLHDARDFRRVGIKSTVTVALLLAAFLLVYHMVFSPAEATKVTSPMYSLARDIRMGRFIQRLESVFIFMWVTSAVVKMAITLWVAAYFLSSTFRWPTFRPVLPALGLLALSLSLLPGGVASVVKLDDQYLWRWGWIVVFALPLFIAFVGAVRRRERRVT